MSNDEAVIVGSVIYASNDGDSKSQKLLDGEEGMLGLGSSATRAKAAP